MTIDEMNTLFNIFRVNNLVLEELAKEPNLPHQHSYEEIIVVKKGTLEHFIDFEATLLCAPFVSFITKGKTHQIKPLQKDGDCDGFVIRFQSEFVSETIFQLYHFFHDHANIAFSTDWEFERFVTLCEMLEEETQQDSLNFAITRSLLNAMLTILEVEKRKLYKSHLANNIDSPFVKFLQLLEKNYHRPVSVSFYAEKLQMSSRNLNLICKRILQKSITEIIQTRKLIEAKHLLTTTDKTIYEIGFAIGYKEKSYFSNIFKKKTGKTPSEFRSEIKSLFS
ncbi:MAG: AraC family transcriptional regulator [Bacteroidota bacterium]